MPPAKFGGDPVVRHDHWNDGNRGKENTYDTAQSGARKEGNNCKDNSCDGYASDKKGGAKEVHEDSMFVAMASDVTSRAR